MLWIVIAVSAALAAAIFVRPGRALVRGGRLAGFAALLVLPTLALMMGFSEHVERSKTTRFCTSCHVMERYGLSLRIDDALHVPATHYQNGRVDRQHACFTCHTNYTLYGDLRSKLRGLHHVYVQYLGQVPDKPRLYSPYNNRECLHCHAGARSFEEAVTHKQEGHMAGIKANQLSCTSSGCHALVHDVDNLQKATFWSGGDQ